MAVNAARRARPLGVAGLVLALLIVALLGAALWLRSALAQAQSEADDREAAMRAAGTHALDLLSVGHRTVDSDIKRILDTSTGAARAEYARNVTTLKETTLKSKVLQTGALRASGLVSMKGNIARVMVVGDAVIRWEGSKQPPQERFYQWNMEVTKIGAAWLVSKTELVL